MAQQASAIQFELFSSAFCRPCAQARVILDEATRLIPGSELTDFDNVESVERAEAEGIRMTPTIIIRTTQGDEVFRAEGAPRLQQMLAAAAKAL